MYCITGLTVGFLWYVHFLSGTFTLTLHTKPPDDLAFSPAWKKVNNVLRELIRVLSRTGSEKLHFLF